MNENEEDLFHQLSNRLAVVRGRALKIKNLAASHHEISEEADKMITALDRAIETMEILKRTKPP